MSNQDEIIHEEILQAALRLYRKYGPTKVTMDNLAKATNRSRSSLYYYFKDRDAIFLAVMNRIADDVAAEISAAVISATNLNDKIYAFCLAKIKTSDGWKHVFHTMDQLMGADDKSKHTNLMDTLHNKLIYLERGILVEALSSADGQATRRNNAAELDLMAFIISSSVRGIRRELNDYNDPHNAKDAAKLLSGMVAKWLML
ncbi:TetR/AcrR family transcriptional regulator [Mucilaginibacter sp.]